MGKFHFEDFMSRLESGDSVSNPDGSANDKKEEIFEKKIPLEKLKKNPLNDYGTDDDEQGIDNLAESIKNNNLIHNIAVMAPLDGEEEIYTILSGERRYKAYLKLAGEYPDEERYRTIDCKVFPHMDETEQMLYIDIANLEVRDGTIEEHKFRKGYLRYVENLKQKYGIERKEARKAAAEQFKVSEKYLKQEENISENLSPELVEKLDNGEMTRSSAVVMSGKSQKAQTQLANKLNKAKEEGADAEELKQIAKKSAESQSSSKPDDSKKDYIVSSNRLLSYSKNLYSQCINVEGSDVEKVTKTVKKTIENLKEVLSIINTKE